MFKKMKQSLKGMLAMLAFASFFVVACNNEAEKKAEDVIDTTGEQKPNPKPNVAADTTTAMDTTGEQKPNPKPNVPQ